MKKLLLLASSALITQVTFADVNFSDNFNSYANGNLVGQGPWTQTGASATTPIQVSSGAAVVGTSGQDIYAALAAPINLQDGQSFYIGADLNFSSAQAAGDYFLHYSSPVGTTSVFQERIFAKSSGSGLVLGYDAGAGTAVNYGSLVLSLNQTYRIVLDYTAVAGITNDTFAMYVNPVDTSVEGNNTAYLTSVYNSSSSPESPTVSAINLRQGTAANAPALTVDNLDVTTTFGEAAVFTVPEPSTIALGVFSGLVGVIWFRRRK